MGWLLLSSIKATENYMYKVMAFFKERRLPVILLGSKTGICLATGKLLRWMIQGHLAEQTLPIGLPLYRYSFEYTMALAH